MIKGFKMKLLPGMAAEYERRHAAICRKWWDYMADIMDVNPDSSPVCHDLKPVFHLD